MADEKENDDKKVIVAEFKISMYCNACERTVAKAIAKLKGVEKFATDMNKHRVIIMGKNIDPKKVVKKLRKKTGKKVEIVVKDDDKQKETSSKDTMDEIPRTSVLPLNCCLLESEEFVMMFNDENPNACSIM